MQSTKQAIFQLGDEEYGLDIMDVKIIEKYIPVEPVANLPKNFKGIIKLRGDVIPVYGLRSKFGLEEKQPDDDTRLMITNSHGISIAYEVDEMIEIISLEADQINEAPSIVKSKSTSYLKSITKVNDRLILMLDHNGLLTEEEYDKIKTVIKK